MAGAVRPTILEDWIDKMAAGFRVLISNELSFPPPRMTGVVMSSAKVGDLH
jgi:hypothetical protein